MDLTEIERLLAEEWASFSGDDGGMEGYKLHRRMQGVTWNPPLLSFSIERHGGTVQGSSRAEVQHWEVDITARSVALVKETFRPAA